MSTRVGTGREIPGDPVAFNPQDWWVRGRGVFDATTVIVGTTQGEVFEHVIENTVKPAVQYSGSPMAFNRPTDKWVTSANRTFLVGLVDGSVFLHSVRGRTSPHIDDPVKLTGAAVAAQPQDTHVMMFDNGPGFDIVVITSGGGVFVHRLTFPGPGITPVIEPAVPATGPPIGHNVEGQEDRWIIAGQVDSFSPHEEIFVITFPGVVTSYRYNPNIGGVPSIGRATNLTGPPVATNPQDRWVLVSGGRIVVINKEGKVTLHDVS